MKNILKYQILVTIMGFFLFWNQSTRSAISFMAGSLAITYVFLTFLIGGFLIFQKKLIALAISLVVFKYAILGLIIYWLVNISTLSAAWFCLGVASFSISALVYAVTSTYGRR